MCKKVLYKSGLPHLACSRAQPANYNSTTDIYGGGSGHRGLEPATPPPPTHPSFRRVDEFSERGLFKVTNPLSLPAHSLQQTVSSSKLCPSEMRLHKHTQYMHKILPHTNTRTHTHDSTPYPTWLWRSSTAPPTPLSISPVWKHFKQTSTLLCYKKGKLQDMLSSIPAGLIRIVLNSHCHAF